MNKKESIEDTAKVFGRMYDAIEYRGFGQDIVEIYRSTLVFLYGMALQM